MYILDTLPRVFVEGAQDYQSLGNACLRFVFINKGFCHSLLQKELIFIQEDRKRLVLLSQRLVYHMFA